MTLNVVAKMTTRLMPGKKKEEGQTEDNLVKILKVEINNMQHL